ncbi:FAD-binding protein [Aquipuribacter hungaricus]|uniref:FAD-binding protein n=1 Tax=Aquipuribacter hungaricus TaxID=545624 RepID=A0ABV7WKU5_9MICO
MQGAAVRTTNWAGNITFSASAVHRPTSVAELQSLVAGARRVRALGSGHSFSPVADTDGELVRLDGLPHLLEVDRDAATITVSGGVTYGEVAPVLHAAGLALPSMGSLPHISVAGASATGTHGSGDSNRVLAHSVVALQLVTADGDLLEVTRESDPERFPGMVVALGSLGVVTRLTLAAVPGFEIAQEVREKLPLQALLDQVDEVLSAGYSVSVFTSWQDPVEANVWIKRLPDAVPQALDWLGSSVADGPRHPVPGMPAGFSTEQMGTPGPWHERLPHFRMEFTPSSGDELQTEYFVPREHASAALAAVAEVAPLVAPVLQIGELRTIAADDLWLSSCYGRDTLAVHFTWVPDLDVVLPALEAVEAALAPFAPRPHWGKVFRMDPEVVASRYPRLDSFRALRDEMDPQRRFANAFVDRYLGA